MRGHDPTAAIADLTPGYARSRVINQIRLATPTMATGDPIEAAALGIAALVAADTIRSRRVTDDLRDSLATPRVIPTSVKPPRCATRSPAQP